MGRGTCREFLHYLPPGEAPLPQHFELIVFVDAGLVVAYSDGCKFSTGREVPDDNSNDTNAKQETVGSVVGVSRLLYGGHRLRSAGERERNALQRQFCGRWQSRLNTADRRIIRLRCGAPHLLKLYRRLEWRSF